MFDTKKDMQRAALLAVNTGEFDSEASMAELSELAETAGAEVLFTVTQNLPSINKATYSGPGKLREIKELGETNELDLLIVDDELTGVQIRNIEAETGLAVIDRTMLILDIFAARAHTNEGKLQVELALQKYRLPRLIGLGASLSKQQGGIGSRGSGESQLEYDRRHIRRRITILEQELDELSKRRERLRDRRRKDSLPAIAIVGYTNVGKSTLLNKLTNAEVFVQDMLFATLDPTARGIELPDGRQALMVDTVGLLRRLPHHLIKAFHSTLEEAAAADLILHICDVSSENAAVQLEVTRELLNELDCGAIPTITVYNKIDKLSGQNVTPIRDQGVAISAKTGAGLDTLLQEIAKTLAGEQRQLELLIPYSKGGLLEFIRQNGKLLSEEYEEGGTAVKANIEQRHCHLFEQYVR